MTTSTAPPVEVDLDRSLWWRTQLLPLRRLARAVRDRPSWLMPFLVPPLALGLLAATLLHADLVRGVSWEVAGPMFAAAALLAACAAFGGLLWLLCSNNVVVD